MKNGITVITPTGDRPKAFELCAKYIQRQTCRPNQWIVIDDGKSDIEFSNFLSVWVRPVKRQKQKREPRHTLPLNILEALPLIEYDTILIMEDDDWYAPTYIEWMVSYFKKDPSKLLIGQGRGLYYHIPSLRFRRCPNILHAGLCKTGFKSGLIPKVEEICKTKMTNPFIDIKLWQKTLSFDKKLIFDEKDYCVGIKGMPGRQGVCAGWTQYMNNTYTYDTDMEYLKSIIGDDVELYKEYVK